MKQQDDLKADFRGKGVITGIAIAKVRKIEEDLSKYMARYHADSLEQEIAKIHASFQNVSVSLSENVQNLKAKGMEEQAAIMEAHRVMAQDPLLLQNALSKVETNHSAPCAVLEATEEAAAMFENIPDAYFRERAVDIRDVGKSIVRDILGIKTGSYAGQEAVILCGNEIEPSVIANIPTEQIAGVLLGQGSTTCHAVIIAKARAIPTIVGIEAELTHISDGDKLIINGETGEVFINPQPDIEAFYRQKLQAQLALKEYYERLKYLPAETTDGRRVKLAANISTHLDVEAAIKNFGAEGVGLFRSEFLLKTALFC